MQSSELCESHKAEIERLLDQQERIAATRDAEIRRLRGEVKRLRMVVAALLKDIDRDGLEWWDSAEAARAVIVEVERE